MALKLGYDYVMQRLALFGLALAVFSIAGSSAPSAYAQAVTLPSVTSLGFGGSNRPGGLPPSVTSLGFGRTGSPGWSGHNHPHNPAFPGAPIVNPRRHGPYYPAWGGYYAYPVFIDSGNAYSNEPEAAEPNPDEYRGGPTIFDRRGDGQYPPLSSDHHSEPVQEALEAKAVPPSQPPAEVAGQPQTILVFKDGHQASVDNYAIVGSTLYDLSGGKRYKILLSELDLNATAQQNDDQGVDFQLPAGLTSK